MDSRTAGAAVDHLTHVRAFTGMFAETLARADPDARLPSSRSWTVTDLAAHLGGVHRWVVEIVRTGRRCGRDNRPALDRSPLDFYRGARAELLDVFDATDPERACWTLSRTDRRVGFWHRRQAHETLVHLWDLRAADDPKAGLDDVDPAVCADGVDELHEVFIPRATPAERPELPGSVALVAADAARSWTVGPQWTFEPGTVGADVTVTAPAATLLLWVWDRPCAGVPQIDGDHRVAVAFRKARVVP